MSNFRAAPISPSFVSLYHECSSANRSVRVSTTGCFADGDFNELYQPAESTSSALSCGAENSYFLKSAEFRALDEVVIGVQPVVEWVASPELAFSTFRRSAAASKKCATRKSVDRIFDDGLTEPVRPARRKKRTERSERGVGTAAADDEAGQLIGDRVAVGGGDQCESEEVKGGGAGGLVIVNCSSGERSCGNDDDDALLNGSDESSIDCASCGESSSSGGASFYDDSATVSCSSGRSSTTTEFTSSCSSSSSSNSSSGYVVVVAGSSSSGTVCQSCSSSSSWDRSSTEEVRSTAQKREWLSGREAQAWHCAHVDRDRGSERLAAGAVRGASRAKKLDRHSFHDEFLSARIGGCAGIQRIGAASGDYEMSSKASPAQRSADNGPKSSRWYTLMDDLLMLRYSAQCGILLTHVEQWLLDIYVVALEDAESDECVCELEEKVVDA